MNFDLISFILTSWISLIDLSLFDIAICNRYTRPLYLDCLENKTIAYEMKNSLNDEIIHWIFMRKLKINQIIIDNHAFSCKSLEIIKNWHHLQGLTIQTTLQSKPRYNRLNQSKIHEIIKFYPMLRSIKLLFSSQVMHCNEILLQVLQYCHELEEIDIRCSINTTSENEVDIVVYNTIFHDSSTNIAVQGYNCIQDDVICALLQSCHDLKTFKMIKIGMNNSIPLQLSRSCNSLQTLDLSNNAGLIISSSFISIAKSCPDLMNLNISWNEDGVNDEVVSAFLHYCPLLTSLDISGENHISDVSILEIASLLPELRHLNISWSESIHNSSIQAIYCQCHRLQHLNVSRIISLTPGSSFPLVL